MNRIAIIGGGASGTLLAINLLNKEFEGGLEINLIEKRAQLGRGVAFSTEKDAHLLNVPAAKMGAFPDDVGHFHRWLGTNKLKFAPNDFVPRRLFGRYLIELLERARKEKPHNVELNIFDDEAVDVTFEDRKAQVELESGDCVNTDKVVLAFGNFQPPHPSVPDRSFVLSEKYFRDPWNPDVFEKVGKDDSVLILGTGLSMADIAVQLNKMGHTGPINALSTRGLLPAVHRLGFTYPNFYDEIKDASRVTDILRVVRKHATLADANGSDWRAVIDSMRGFTQELWLWLPLPEKRNFIQHLSRYWNVARHRMPPETAAVIDELRGTGQLRILKGRLEGIEGKRTGGFGVRYTRINTSYNIHADAIVNCIGSESKFDQLESPLVKNLLQKGLIRCDDVQLGLEATPGGALKGATGTPSTILFTLGTSLRGILWESTAIPEIREQARSLSSRLAAYPPPAG